MPSLSHFTFLILIRSAKITKGQGPLNCLGKITLHFKYIFIDFIMANFVQQQNSTDSFSFRNNSTYYKYVARMYIRGAMREIISAAWIIIVFQRTTYNK